MSAKKIGLKRTRPIAEDNNIAPPGDLFSATHLNRKQMKKEMLKLKETREFAPKQSNKNGSVHSHDSKSFIADCLIGCYKNYTKIPFWSRWVI